MEKLTVVLDSVMVLNQNDDVIFYVVVVTVWWL